jgi:hypothetical protein
MQLMKDAGFVSVFLGIETPDESDLIAVNTPGRAGGLIV